MSDEIKEGEWFCAVEGLAIADKIYDEYFEEYDRIPQGKAVGDLKMSVIQYRLFCDFDGLPIKRNRLKLFNARCCAPFNVEWDCVLRKSISDNPKEYASFLKFLKIHKDINGCVTVNYSLSERDKGNIDNIMGAIHSKLPSKFTFLDFIQIAKAETGDIDWKTPIYDTYFGVPLFIRVRLVYKFGDGIGKRLLFNHFDYTINGELACP